MFSVQMVHAGSCSLRVDGLVSVVGHVLLHRWLVCTLNRVVEEVSVDSGTESA